MTTSTKIPTAYKLLIVVLVISQLSWGYVFMLMQNELQTMQTTASAQLQSIEQMQMVISTQSESIERNESETRDHESLHLEYNEVLRSHKNGLESHKRIIEHMIKNWHHRNFAI